jgi:hypothetical protein
MNRCSNYWPERIGTRVLEGCVRQLEEDETVDSVGFDGVPNILGEMDLDAFHQLALFELASRGLL